VAGDRRRPCPYGGAAAGDRRGWAGAALVAEGIGPATIAHLVQSLSIEALRATGLDAAGAQARISGTST
jgi:hypothetical protein